MNQDETNWIELPSQSGQSEPAKWNEMDGPPTNALICSRWWVGFTKAWIVLGVESTDKHVLFEETRLLSLFLLQQVLTQGGIYTYPTTSDGGSDDRDLPPLPSSRRCVPRQLLHPPLVSAAKEPERSAGASVVVMVVTRASLRT